jgi:hypothetical protein
LRLGPVEYKERVITTSWERYGNNKVVPLLKEFRKTAGEWSPSCPGQFTHRNRVTGIYWMADWVGTRASMDNFEKINILLLLRLKF